MGRWCWTVYAGLEHSHRDPIGVEKPRLHEFLSIMLKGTRTKKWPSYHGLNVLAGHQLNVDATRSKHVSTIWNMEHTVCLFSCLLWLEPISSSPMGPSPVDKQMYYFTRHLPNLFLNTFDTRILWIRLLPLNQSTEKLILLSLTGLQCPYSGGQAPASSNKFESRNRWCVLCGLLNTNHVHIIRCKHHINHIEWRNQFLTGLCDFFLQLLSALLLDGICHWFCSSTDIILSSPESYHATVWHIIIQQTGLNGLNYFWGDY